MFDVRPVTGNGVVTIPKHIRDDLNIKAGDKVAFIKLDSGQYLITKSDSAYLKNVIMVDPKPGYSTEPNQNDQEK